MISKQMKIFSFLLFSVIFAVIFCFSFKNTQVLAQNTDVIGIRVYKNPDHLSPGYWYKKNINISGSPQSLIIDGYNAVRDGRTVYVNAGVTVGNTLYTNIYVISYNEDADAETVDIFGKILRNWKFNSTLVTHSEYYGVCIKGIEETTTVCVSDFDCRAGEYCSGIKAKATRDIERAEIEGVGNFILDEYQKTHDGKYPELISGTYVPGMSTSVWPSWNDMLSSKLRAKLPMDPVNNVMCTSVQSDPKTCWNSENNTFNEGGGVPGGALILVYRYDGATGRFYFQNTESGFNIP